MDNIKKDINTEKVNADAMFIKTQDEKSMEQLLAANFELINFDGKTWTFSNSNSTGSKKLNFDSIKIAYSNILCL